MKRMNPSLREEVRVLEADEEDRLEMQAVAAIMENLRPPALTSTD